MNTSQKIMQILENYVDTIFFVSGGGIAFLCDAMGQSNIKYIPMICESGASSAAVGYAMSRNSLGVVLVTSGPGICNAITGIASAYTDSIPLLAIGGTARSDTLIGQSDIRTKGIQEINGVGITTPITKCSVQAHSGIHAINTLKSMIKLCLKERNGPCFLEIPLDIQNEEIDE